MKKDKPLTKKQYQQYQEELNKEKDIVKYVARILACAFLLGIIIFLVIFLTNMLVVEAQLFYINWKELVVAQTR